MSNQHGFFFYDCVVHVLSDLLVYLSNMFKWATFNLNGVGNAKVAQQKQIEYRGFKLIRLMRSCLFSHSCRKMMTQMERWTCVLWFTLIWEIDTQPVIYNPFRTSQRETTEVSLSNELWSSRCTSPTGAWNKILFFRFLPKKKCDTYRWSQDYKYSLISLRFTREWVQGISRFVSLSSYPLNHLPFGSSEKKEQRNKNSFPLYMCCTSFLKKHTFVTK